MSKHSFYYFSSLFFSEHSLRRSALVWLCVLSSISLLSPGSLQTLAFVGFNQFWLLLCVRSNCLTKSEPINNSPFRWLSVDSVVLPNASDTHPSGCQAYKLWNLPAYLPTYLPMYYHLPACLPLPLSILIFVPQIHWAFLSSWICHIHSCLRSVLHAVPSAWKSFLLVLADFCIRVRSLLNASATAMMSLIMESTLDLLII